MTNRLQRELLRAKMIAVRGVYRALAGESIPEAVHGRAVCPQCGWGFALTHDDILRYLRSGWPQCCGETMRWIRPPGTTDE